MSRRTFRTAWFDHEGTLHTDRARCTRLSQMQAEGVNLRRALRKVKIDLARYVETADRGLCRSCALAPAVSSLLRAHRRRFGQPLGTFVQFNLEAPEGERVPETGPEQREYSRIHLPGVARVGDLIVAEDPRGPFSYGFVDPIVAEALELLVRFRETEKEATARQRENAAA